MSTTQDPSTTHSAPNQNKDEHANLSHDGSPLPIVNSPPTFNALKVQPSSPKPRRVAQGVLVAPHDR